MSFLRRFLYMVVKGARRDNQHVYTLRRIKVSRFFYPDPAPLPPAPSPGGIEEAPLPPRCARFCAPMSEHGNGRVEFMLLTRDKVLAADPIGRTTIYDGSFRLVQGCPVFRKPTVDWPISIPVDGGGLYVVDSKRYFQALLRRSFPDIECPTLSSYEDWTCEELPTAPQELPRGSHRAYTVVGGGSIWISDDGDGTYAYDISRCAWAKQAEWALPFSGLVEYVSEHKLWFGLSRKNKGNPMCACDLAAAAAADRGSPPVLRNVWELDVKPRKKWVPHFSSLVHLGSARFYIVRIFSKPSSKGQSEWEVPPKPEEVFAVLTTVEVVRSGELGRGLRMVKHKSVRYSIGECYHLEPLMVF